MFSSPDQAWIVRLGCFLGCTRQVRLHGGRRFDAVAREHGAGVSEGRRVGHGRPRSDRGRIVAGNVGDQQAHHLGRMGRGSEPAALDRREVLADHIHLADVGATGEKRPVDRLLVREREPLGRQGEQRRAATRDQAQDQIVRSGALGQLEDPPGCGLACGVGDGMRRLDDLDPLAGHGMAVASDDEALERPGPVFLDRFCHGGGGLAGAEDDRASLGW